MERRRRGVEGGNVEREHRVTLCPREKPKPGGGVSSCWSSLGAAGAEPDALYIHPQHVGLTPMEVAILLASELCPNRVDDATTDAPPTPLRLGASRVAPLAAVTHVVLPGGRIRAPPTEWEVVSFDTAAADGAAQFPLLRSVPFPVRMLAPDPNNDLGIVTTGAVPKYRALALKLHTWLHFARGSPPGKVLFFIDARDVLWGGCTTDLLAAFLALNKTIVFAAELGCLAYQQKQASQCDRFPEPPPEQRPTSDPDLLDCDFTCAPSKAFKFLNSGVVVGYAGALATFYGEVLATLSARWINRAKAPPFDQDIVIDTYLERWRARGYGLDYTAALSVQAHRMKRASLLVQPRALYSRVFEKRACFVHLNGGAKWMLPVFANEPLLFGGDGSDDDGKGDSLPRASSSSGAPPPPPPPSPPSPSRSEGRRRAEPRHDLGPMGELFPPIDPQQQPSAAKPTLHRLPGPAQSLCRGQQHQTGLLDDEAGVDTLPSLLPPPARRPRPLTCATAGGEDGILLALGILSGGGHTELRDAARQTWLRFAPVGQSVVRASRSAWRLRLGDALHAEAARHADLIFVNATAVADGSAMQAFGWWFAAPARLPRATYIGKTDDDSFVHIPRLLAHLGGLLRETTGDGRAVYAGHLQFTTPNPRKAEGCAIWANNFEEAQELYVRRGCAGSAHARRSRLRSGRCKSRLAARGLGRVECAGAARGGSDDRRG